LKARAYNQYTGFQRTAKCLLYSGSFERGQAATITGYKERQARTVLKKLVELGLLVSDTPKGAVRLGFPTDIVERYFPKLYVPTV
jgi:Fic family protein